MSRRKGGTFITYSSVTSAHKQNHGDIFDNTNSGVTTEIVANAFNMVKARVQAAGLTPPASNDILAVAENFYIKAELAWKERIMGTLPAGANVSIVSNDNVNKSYAMFMELGNQKVDEYIATQTGIPTTGTTNIRTNYNYKMLHYSGSHYVKKVNA